MGKKARLIILVLFSIMLAVLLFVWVAGILDLGNVVVRFDHGRACRAAARRSPLSADDILRRLWGSGLVVVGALAVLYLYPRSSAQVEYMVFNHKWFLPVALMVPTAAGVIMQNQFVKKSKDWNI